MFRYEAGSSSPAGWKGIFMRISITNVFSVLQEPASQGGISGRVILPASCEATIADSLVRIAHPHADVTIPIDRFNDLVRTGIVVVIME